MIKKKLGPNDLLFYLYFIYVVTLTNASGSACRGNYQFQALKPYSHRDTWRKKIANQVEFLIFAFSAHTCHHIDL